VESAVAPERDRPSIWVVIAIGLFATAIVSTWLGSADPPIDTRNSAYWYRTLAHVRGLTDTCGDFTWFARAIPASLALAGGALGWAFAERRARWILVAAGLFLAACLWMAAVQNAVPIGQQRCIID
jgi:hypothetical protein